jgi:CheY-like chemotaxis protein/anti-sigma regulatory factor (Ser/Thr protein kinase)
MNLCTNAVHAMREGGGVLAVEAKPFRADDGGAILGIGTGDYVEISVRDSGVGMDSGLLERVFDPFFTTREHGQGAGLGLSVVHGIVRSHNGAITVESAPGKGSTFRVYLPRSLADGDAGEQRGDEAKGGGERILLVDDDEALLEMGCDMIEELGYAVSAAASGEEAVALFKAEPQLYDLVITDHTMADMTGAELSLVIREMRSVPVLLLTGFDDSPDAADLNTRGIARVLTKPLTRAELSTAIRQVLTGER